MKDTTTIVIGVGLMAGAIYLATREDKTAVGDVVDDGGGGLCGNVGTLNKQYGAACGIGAALLGGLKSLTGSACSKAGGHLGTWSKEDGFTGNCRRKTASYAGMKLPSKWVFNWNHAGTQLCCNQPNSDARCFDRPHWKELEGSCTDGFDRDPKGIRDHRTGAAK